MIFAFRQQPLQPLGCCLYMQQPKMLHLTWLVLHRCRQQHGMSRLPDVEGDKPKRQKFKRYHIASLRIDVAEVQTAEGKLYLLEASTAPPRSPLPNFLKRLTNAPLGSSCRTCWRLCHIGPHSICRSPHPIRRATPEPQHHLFSADALRHDLRDQRDRAPTDQAQPPVDQWPS
jgi:hypothetical protein